MSSSDESSGSSPRERVGFMFGNTTNKLRLEKEEGRKLFDEDALEALDTLGDNAGGGDNDVPDVKVHKTGGAGDTRIVVPSTSQLVDADAFPEADAYIDVPDDPAPMVPVLGAPLLSAPATTAFAAAAEEDNYDLDEDEPAAAAPGSIPAPAISVLQQLQTQGLLDGHVVIPEVVPLLPSGVTSMQPFAAEVGHGVGVTMVPVAQPMVQISTATGGVYLPPPPPPVCSLEDMEAEQAEKAKKAGVRLPVLARDHKGAILSFSDLFQPQPEEPQAKSSKPARHAVNAARSKMRAATAVDARRGEDDADDEQLLRAASTDMVATLSASESEGDEDEPEAAAGSPTAETAGKPGIPDAKRDGANQAYRRLRRFDKRGAEPLQAAAAALDSALGDLSVPSFPEANFEAVHASEWEAGVVWGSDSELDDLSDQQRQSQEDDDTELDQAQPSAPTHGMMSDSRAWPSAAPWQPSLEAVAEGTSVAALGFGAGLPDMQALLAGRGTSASTPEMTSSHLSRRVQRLSLVDAAKVEPLPSGRAVKLSTRLHAQQLRLEQLQITTREPPTSDSDAERPDTVPQRYNESIVSDQWLEEVAWEGSEAPPPAFGKIRLLLDTNDPGMTFTAMRRADASLRSNAAASILPFVPKLKVVSGPAIAAGPAAQELARFNVSKDHLYQQPVKRKGLLAVTKHAVCAATLSTLPIIMTEPARLDHRPRGIWLPSADIIPPPLAVKKQKKAAAGLATVQLVSSVFALVSQTFSDCHLATVTAAALWASAAQNKFSGSRPGEVPLMFLQDSRGGASVAIPPDVPLAQTPAAACGLRVVLVLVFRKISPLFTGVANAVPAVDSKVPLRPPGAFSKRKDLTATDGHVLALEYMEETPLMLNRPGMTVKLATYYRRKHDRDTGHLAIRRGADMARWKVGLVTPLGPSDEAPLLGQLQEGVSLLTAESGTFKAAAVPHDTQPTDFLLVRDSAGRLSVRELTGTIVMGQQEPKMKVPYPRTKEKRLATDIEEHRLEAHIVRELRSRQTKMDKKGLAGRAFINYSELRALFPLLRETTIRGKLVNECQCEIVRGDPDKYQVIEGVRLKAESELRELATPDEWCAWESLVLGHNRFCEMGVRTIRNVAIERLRLAAEQLPNRGDPEVKKAVNALEHAVQSSPWALTENYISAVLEKRGHLALVGAGDPSGRGRAFSFTKDPRRVAAEKMDAARAGQKSITGTAADLRKLGMQEARQRLLEMSNQFDLGLTDEMISKMKRWDRIKWVREFSSARVADGSDSAGTAVAKFARSARVKSEEYQQRYRSKCQQIFERQMGALTAVPEEMEVEEDEGSDADSFGKEFEDLLADSDDEESKEKDDEDEESMAQALREEGFIEESAQGTAARAPKLEAKPGERRLRRVIHYTMPDGTPAQKEVFITNRDKVMAVNQLSGDSDLAGPWGFGKRRVRGKGRLIKNDASAMGAKRKYVRRGGQGQGRRSNKSDDDGDSDVDVGPALAKARKRRKFTVELNDLDSPPAKRRRSGPVGKKPKAKAGIPGKKHLGNLLARVVNALKSKQHPNAGHISLFVPEVSKKNVKDYNKFVPVKNEMWLKKMAVKAKAGKYSSLEAFRADIEQIGVNARTYNSQGKFKMPEAMEYANTLTIAAERELAARAHELSAAEQRMYEDAI